jgi:hypothetical protein
MTTFFVQVSPVVAKRLIDDAIDSCGQTLIDREPWGASWYALNMCLFTLQFRHPDLASELQSLDLRRFVHINFISALSHVLFEALRCPRIKICFVVTRIETLDETGP